MKLSLYAILLLSIFLSNCSSLDKEILEIEKQKLDVERERLKLERDRMLKCNNCCQQPTLSLKTEVKPILPLEEKAVLYVEPIGCNKIKTPSSDDIWQISESGEWSYPPNLLELGITCREEKKNFSINNLQIQRAMLQKSKCLRPRKVAVSTMLYFMEKTSYTAKW